MNRGNMYNTCITLFKQRYRTRNYAAQLILPQKCDRTTRLLMSTDVKHVDNLQARIKTRTHTQPIPSNKPVGVVSLVFHFTISSQIHASPQIHSAVPTRLAEKETRPLRGANSARAGRSVTPL